MKLWLILFGVTFASCSLEPSMDGRGRIGGEDSMGQGEKDSSSTTKSMRGMDSVKAYETTVYKLVQEVTCKKCHTSELSPFFAAPNVQEAHDIIIDTQKVNFDSPEQSRMVLRLSDNNHNCWSDCAADAKEMLAAIKEWIRLAQTSEEEDDGAVTTDALTLADVQPREGDAGDAGTIIMEGEDGSLQTPMTVQTNGAASGGEFAVTPPGNGGLLQAGNGNAGAVTYTIEVTEPGPYRLWGRVSTANSNQNSFYVRVDNGPFLNWRTAVTNGQWAWELATNQDVGGTVLSFNLTPGTHSLAISQREDGARLDVLAITNDPNFTGGGESSGEAIDVLRFDLSSLIGQDGVYFEIEASEFDQFSFKFKNPAILTDAGPVQIKGIKILINGVFDPQNSTYLQTNETVEAPGGILSSAAMIVPIEKGFDLDEISVSFDKLKIK